MIFVRFEKGVAHANFDVHQFPVERCLQCVVSVLSSDGCSGTDFQYPENVVFEGYYDFIDGLSDSKFSFPATFDLLQNTIVLLKNEDNLPVACGLFLPPKPHLAGVGNIRRT